MVPSHADQILANAKETETIQPRQIISKIDGKCPFIDPAGRLVVRTKGQTGTSRAQQKSMSHCSD
jgi:hypothetical protein